MSKRDYYEVLGVARTCAVEEVKLAYRKLAMECHPDRNPGDPTAEHKFKELSEAYEILKDPDKRAAYDRFGHAAFENGGRGGPGGFDFAASFTDVFDDLFGEFMGGKRSRRSKPRRRSSLQYGDRARGRLSRQECGNPRALADCLRGMHRHRRAAGHDSGNLRHLRRPRQSARQPGLLHHRAHLPQMPGRGPRRAPSLQGLQRPGAYAERAHVVGGNSPGVEEGTRIRLSGEGQAGLNGGPPGDLYIFLSVQQHPIFQRDAQDLHCRVPIGFVTAALGGEIEVPTLSGARARVTIPEGVQSGHQLKLRGKGMPVLKSGGHHGDLFVEVRVETPVKLTKKQKELLRTFEAESPKGCNPDSETFFAKMKEFLGAQNTRPSLLFLFGTVFLL